MNAIDIYIKVKRNLKVGLRGMIHFIPDIFLYFKIRKSARISSFEWGFYVNGHLGDTYVFAAMLSTFSNSVGKDKIKIVGSEKYRELFSLFLFNNYVSAENVPDYLFSDVISNFVKFQPGNLLPGRVSHIFNTGGMTSDLSKFVFKSKSLSLDTPKNLGETTLNSLVIKYRIPSLKNVIWLAPYSYTVNRIPESFWIETAKELESRGYNIIFFRHGSEETISGYHNVDIDIGDVIPLVNEAAAVISVRNGFVDLISSSRTKKVVIYRTEKDLLVYSITEYYSDNRERLMELCYNSSTNHEAFLSSILYFISSNK
jgi:hypothetical protein